MTARIAKSPVRPGEENSFRERYRFICTRGSRRQCSSSLQQRRIKREPRSNNGGAGWRLSRRGDSEGRADLGVVLILGFVGKSIFVNPWVGSGIGHVPIDTGLKVLRDLLGKQAEAPQ